MINEPIKDWKAWRGTCVICQIKVNKRKEKYVKLTDYDKGKEVSYCLYHLECWKNRFAITSMNMEKMANRWLGQISKMGKNIRGDKIVEIKN